MSSRARRRAKARASTRLPCLLLLCPTLLACHPQDRRADGPGELQILDIAAAAYSPRQGERAIPSEEAACKAWRLDARQAETFFRLSKPLREGELHDYDWLPCSIKGHLTAEGERWEFEINAAGTSTWRGKDQARLMGCGQAACAPLVIMTPQGPQE